MRWAFVMALVVHALLLLLPVGYRGNGTLFVLPAPNQQPVVVALQPKDGPKRLIAPGAPADASLDPDTDLIAERASKAQDMTPDDTPGNVPDAGAVGPIDDIVSSAPVSATPVVPIGPSQPAETAQPTSPVPKPDPKEPPRPVPAARPMPILQTPAHEIDQDPAPPISGQTQVPQDATLQLAKADPPQLTQHTMGKTQSRVEGGVKSLGFLSFEAAQSEFAPYLRDVRDRVERRWKTIMHVRYSGTTTAQAVLDCTITPDGSLDKVSIIEPGNSATFAGLCKQAIEQAGPFGPFPFKVPEVYQNQNIEIRWTFSFL